ncbi:hypothetical protein CLU79DRAFT_722257 [Phycomyces nitens]|nr:hypothetical protein CLU79DRAFT_722257 [Phycomyces nitens]
MTNTTIQTVADEHIDLQKLARQEESYLVYPKTTYPELKPFDHSDPGHRADSKKASLYDNATKVFDLTPGIGTEIHGLQLSKLTDQQKNDLALLVAERGVVFFRDQDLTPHQGRKFGEYFGPLLIHNVLGHPPGYPEILTLLTGLKNDKIIKRLSNYSGPADAWHSDVTYELQPPGLTFLKIDTLPEVGGDTLWASGYSAYDKLSPALQKFLEGLEAVHSGDEQINAAKAAGSVVRRKEAEHIHPVIRTHPVTGLKSIYVNPVFTRRIVGLSKRESDTILNFLYAHVTGGYDFHVRFKWQENSIAIWDNRVTLHCPIGDYGGIGKRHGWRITTQAERPVFDPKSKSRTEELKKRDEAKTV